LTVNFIQNADLNSLDPNTELRIVHMLGDSQALVYDGLIGKYYDNNEKITIFKFVAIHCPRTCEPLVGTHYQQLVREDVLNAVARIGAFRQQGLTRDVLVFSDGSFQMHNFLYARGIVNDIDFEEPGKAVARDIDRPIVPYALIQQEVRQQLAKLELGSFLKVMATSNFPIQFMVPPPPPHKSDTIINDPHESFRPEGRNMPIIPLLTRTKVHRTFIKEIESICLSEGVEPVNLWDETTEDHALKPQFELDGAHPNRNFAMCVGTRIIERTISIELGEKDVG
tara:strand:- start:1225 stop:2070 length:846 start_codon:yes stop_codon:yes gene_type:complete